MKKRIFWTTFFILSMIAEVSLPLLWGLLATIPAAFISWWVAYRSDWF